MKNAVSALVVALVVLMGGVASGATYYVATTGADTNAGTLAAPWLTLQHAVDTVANGDTILVQPGNYAGCRIESSGAAGAPKTLKSPTPGAAVVNSAGANVKHGSRIEVENWDTGSVSYWVIDGLAVDGTTQTAGWGIDLRGTDHITVQNCTVHNAKVTGIFGAFSYNVLIQNNTSYSNGEHGIYVNNSSDTGVLRGNTLHNNTSLGIHMNGDASMGGDGIMSGWMIENNTSYSNVNGFDADGVDTSTWRNNLAYNNTSKGIQVTGVDGAITSNNDNFYNNTLVVPATGFYCINIIQADGALPPPINNKIKNNILYNYNNVSGRGSICTSASGFPGFESDYNVVMNYFGIDDNAVVNTLAQWRARGYDVHSIQAADTALFVSPSTNDYHLKAGSPAIDAGTTLAAVPTDKEGVTRPQGAAYDIGCFEVGVSVLTITTSSLPNGQISVSYGQTLAAAGGQTPYTWSLNGGSLPAGLSLSSGGVISGTPTAAGASSFTARVTDNLSAFDDQALSITIPADLVVTTSSLPNGSAGVAYSQALAATGGVTPYTWSLNGGSLPAGLSLSSGGVISGTPTTAGASSFTVRAIDSQVPSDMATKALSITVTPATLVITTASLPNGVVGAAYSQALAAAGGVMPYTWSRNGGALPAGLSLSSGGLISGTPTAAGTSNFTARVTDSQGPAATADKPLSIAVTVTPPASGYEFSSSDVESSTASTAWQNKATLTFSPPVADTWLILAFAEYKGSDGAYSTLVRTQLDGATVSDVTKRAQVPGDYVSYVSSYVTSLTAAPHTVKIDFCSGNAAATALVRSARIVAIRRAQLELANVSADSTVPLTTAVTNYATLNFTPATAGDYLLIWTAEVSANTGYSTDVRALFNSAVADRMLFRPKANADYVTFASFAVKNCAASPQTIAVAAAKAAGSAAVQNIRRVRLVAVRLSGSRFTPYQSASADTLTTTASTTFVQKLTNAWSAAAAGNWLILSSAELTGSTINYSTEGLVQVNDTAVSGQSLRRPKTAGDIMDFASVDVRNLASGANKVDMDFRAANAGSPAGMLYSHLIVMPLPATAGPADLFVATTSLPNGQMSVAYNQTLAAGGGQAPYSWALAGGALPAGLSLSSGGVISGTPSTAGTASFTVLLTDSQAPADTATKPLSITTPPDLVVTTSSLPNGQIGIAYSQALAAGGGQAPYSWALTGGTLPAGLSLSSGGVVSGTPTTTAVSSFTVRATDSETPADTAAKALSITVTPASLAITTASLPGAVYGAAYSQGLTATGGVTPYSWSVLSGSLPAGLSLNASTGVISGTATAAGTSSFTARVTDSQGPAATADKPLSITVTVGALSVTTASLPSGRASVAYSQTLQATGGIAPYTWSVLSGSLPAGLSLNASTGVVSGTPTTSGSSSFTVRVTDSQGPAATADKPLSITVALAASGYEFAASDAETATLSTAWQNKVTLTFSPTVADTWLIFAFAEYKGSDVAYDAFVRTQVDGVTVSDVVKRPQVAGDYVSYVSSYVTSLAAGAHTVTIGFCSADATVTAYLRSARIVAVRKADLELANASADSTVALTTTLTNYATLNFTPATAGDYLLIWTAEASANIGYSTDVRALFNGATADDTLYRPKANTDYVTFASFAVKNCAASPQTIAIAAAKAAGSTAVQNIRRARLVAVRLSGSRLTPYQSVSADTVTTTASTTFVQKLTNSWSAAEAGNWLVLSSAQLMGSTINYSTEGRVQVDDTAVSGQSLRRPKTAGDVMDFASVDVRNLAAGANKVDMDFRTTNAASPAGILYAHVIVLPLQ